MQFNCVRCGERIRLVNKAVGCPNGCENPFGYDEEKNVGDLSPNFSRSELACKDCGLCVLDPKLVPALEKYRAILGAPVEVDCGYRCPLHNSEVGGVSKSTHLKGEAADVKSPGKTLQEQYDAAEQVPEFGGIGVYDTGFLHVDVRQERARWARVDGKYVGIAESKLLGRWD